MTSPATIAARRAKREENRAFWKAARERDLKQGRSGSISAALFPRALRVAAMQKGVNHAYPLPGVTTTSLCGATGLAGVRGGGGGPEWMVTCPACSFVLSLRALAFLAPLRPSKEDVHCVKVGDRGIQRWKCARVRAGNIGDRDPVFDKAVREIEDRPVPVPRACAANIEPRVLRAFARRDDAGRWEIVDLPT